MTRYLVTVWAEESLIRELWPAIGAHGQSMTSAEKYAHKLSEFYPDYKYIIRPVTDEQVREVTA